MKLYEITSEMQDLLIHLEEAGGELTPDLQARWDTLGLEGSAKVDATAAVLKGMDASEEALAQEIARLSARKAAIQGQKDRLKALLLPAVQALGGKCKTERFTVGVQTRKTQAIELAPGADVWGLPQDWYRVREPELCKTVIKDALKAGAEIPPELTVVEGSTTFVVVR